LFLDATAFVVFLRDHPNEKLSLVEHFLAAGFQIDGKAMNHLLKMEKRSAAEYA